MQKNISFENISIKRVHFIQLFNLSGPNHQKTNRSHFNDGPVKPNYSGTIRKEPIPQHPKK
ncbi:hypothetical protein KCTC52924_02296 [Arenibacter antarcticus]|uniref:Uncharacterized protein n=1 Tax=Arenibacter antarcticus TaxID=2040469 RepID=A0ABW5VK71_9FLAO|nr:hypothetical protein [Arenibacter sp. H213]MCM4169698.1 hypothetical protein [Arenibacter sp. H213]